MKIKGMWHFELFYVRFSVLMTEKTNGEYRISFIENVVSISSSVTYFNYLLFCLQLFFVGFENSAKFAQKFFLGGKLFV